MGVTANMRGYVIVDEKIWEGRREIQAQEALAKSVASNESGEEGKVKL